MRSFMYLHGTKLHNLFSKQIFNLQWSVITSKIIGYTCFARIYYTLTISAHGIWLYLCPNALCSQMNSYHLRNPRFKPNSPFRLHTSVTKRSPTDPKLRVNNKECKIASSRIQRWSESGWKLDLPSYPDLFGIRTLDIWCLFSHILTHWWFVM